MILREDFLQWFRLITVGLIQKYSSFIRSSFYHGLFIDERSATTDFDYLKIVWTQFFILEGGMYRGHALTNKHLKGISPGMEK